MIKELQTEKKISLAVLATLATQTVAFLIGGAWYVGKTSEMVASYQRATDYRLDLIENRLATIPFVIPPMQVEMRITRLEDNQADIMESLNNISQKLDDHNNHIGR